MAHEVIVKPKKLRFTLMHAGKRNPYAGPEHVTAKILPFKKPKWLKLKKFLRKLFK